MELEVSAIAANRERCYEIFRDIRVLIDRVSHTSLQEHEQQAKKE